MGSTRVLPLKYDGTVSLIELAGIIHQIGFLFSLLSAPLVDASYLSMQADNDKDGRLTLTEMIDNPYVFYSAVFNDDEDEYDYHDEFR